MLHDTNVNVRSNAAASLGSLAQPSPDVLSALIHTILHDTEASVRSRAAQSLGQLAQSSPEALSLSSMPCTILKQACDPGQHKFRSTRSVLFLKPSPLSSMPCCTITKQAFAPGQHESLGHLAQPSPEALSALIHALLHDDVNVRSRAAQSLGHLAHASPEVIRAVFLKHYNKMKFGQYAAIQLIF